MQGDPRSKDQRRKTRKKDKVQISRIHQAAHEEEKIRKKIKMKEFGSGIFGNQR